MKFTLSWLKDHLDTSSPLEDIVHRLVELGIEVESVDNPAEKLKSFVVGHVVESGKHPNADRLSLCYVDIGSGEKIQVVCGAPNMRQGLKVAFAPIGAVIPATGEPLKKGKIRDVESLGMCCSYYELNLAEDHEGIIELPDNAPIGAPIAEVLGLNDPVIEVAITPNRADCFGVRGIARDLAASGMGTLKPLPYPDITSHEGSPITMIIEDSQGCPAFDGVYIKDVKNGQSPDWVQKRLTAIGLRPINALVDVTNYLSYDLCRPLHVFDAEKIKDHLVIRRAREGEKLLALNGKEYDLDESMVVIADAQGVLSLGGVMGGESSGCKDETTNVFIECAAFDPIRTAHTGRKLHLLSDARTRFERGVDPESISFGLNAAVALIQEWCGGKVSKRISAQHQSDQPNPEPLKPILLDEAKLRKLSGLTIPLQEAKSYLEKLGFRIKESDQGLWATPPSHRFDIFEAADLVEEVLRLKGYDHLIAAPLPSAQITSSATSKADMAKRLFASRGMNEVVTWSFMKEPTAQLFGFDTPTLKLENPISQDLSVMRPSLVANLIDAAIRNEARGIENAQFFEVGPQYTGRGEQSMVSGLCFGQSGPRHWLTPPRDMDIYDAKAHILALFASLGMSESSFQIEANAPSYYHPGRSATLKQGQKILAYFGEIHPKIGHYFDTSTRMVAFEIFLDNLTEAKTKKSALALSPYQPVIRDFAFLVDKSTPVDQIIKTIQKVDRHLITSVEIFDLYEGDKIPEGKKSVAFAVRLEPQSKTLTDEEIQTLSVKIISQVEKTSGGSLRAS